MDQMSNAEYQRLPHVPADELGRHLPSNEALGSGVMCVVADLECLNSALSFWDLSDEVPDEVHLAVPRGSHRPIIDYPPTLVHVFAAGTFDLGREWDRLDSGEEISISSPARSVVDAVRMRSRVGDGVAYEALRRYLRRPDASLGDPGLEEPCPTPWRC